MRNLFLLGSIFVVQIFEAQPYAPPVGQSGSTALHKDSSAFVSWATSCTIKRGYLDISNKALGFASAGDSSLALGKAMANSVVSLGDGGEAVCTFAYPIKNGPGNDFAVFENSFDDTFLELAFVEASSDGINFFRFPAHSLSDTVNQTGSFGSTDATKINNLAGKYRGGYGTPFDLQELAAKPGLNVNAITHIKIVDVVGSLNFQNAKRDSYGNKINDPWPTPFASGGFDLDAIGVIHQTGATELKDEIAVSVNIFPNPAPQNALLMVSPLSENMKAELMDINGKSLRSFNSNPINLVGLVSGLYFLKITTTSAIEVKKIVIR